jgi:hypothetical protein
VHIAVALNVVAFAMILWSIFAPGDNSTETPLPPPIDELALAKTFLRGTFTRPEIGAFLVPQEGEVAIEKNSMVLRNALVRTQSTFASAGNMRFELDLSIDPKAPPAEVSISMFSDSSGGYYLGWNARGEGWVKLDGERRGMFVPPPLDAKMRRLTIIKNGQQLTIREGTKELVNLPRAFTEERNGTIQISSKGGTLQVGSIMVVGW